MRGLPNDSTYSTAIRVTPSCTHQVSRSLLDTSYLSPTDANDDTPIPSRDRCSSTAIPTPPDCTTSPATPGRNWPPAKVAFSPAAGTSTPRQFGPTSRMPYRRQMASRSAPSAPRPEVITTRARTPRRPHASATSGTAAAGTAMTARSGTSGRSATEATQWMPSMLWPCGLTA